MMVLDSAWQTLLMRGLGFKHPPELSEHIYSTLLMRGLGFKHPPELSESTSIVQDMLSFSLRGCCSSALAIHYLQTDKE